MTCVYNNGVIRHVFNKNVRRGRIVVLAEIRKALGVAEGETLLGEMHEGEFVLTTRRAAWNGREVCSRNTSRRGHRLWPTN